MMLNANPVNCGYILFQYFFSSHDTEARESWLNELRHSIKHCNTSAVYNAAGSIVSWGLIRLNGAGDFAHTLPDYRNLGLFSHVDVDLMQQALQGASDIYGFVLATNAIRQHIAMEKFGYTNAAEVGQRFYEPNRANL